MTMQVSQNLTPFVLQYQGRLYPLNKPQLLIGREGMCDVRVQDDPLILPLHAQVIAYAGRIFVEPMESGASLWVNGSPVSAAQTLKPGDELVLGDGRTRLRLLRSETPAEQEVTLTGLKPSSVEQPRGIPPAARPFAAASSSQPQPHSQPLDFPPGYAPVPQASSQRLEFAATTSPEPSPSPSRVLSRGATDPTRYLCAAAHLDETFQDYVLRHVIYESHKAQGESYGVDMPLVVSWCKAAVKRLNVRDMLLTAILVLAPLCVVSGLVLFNQSTSSVPYSPTTYPYPPVYYTAPTPSLASSSFFSLFVGLLVTCVVLVLLDKMFGFSRSLKRRWPDARPGGLIYVIILILFLLLALIGLPLAPLALLLVLAMPLIIFIELLVRFFGSSVRRLRRGAFDPRFRPVPLDYELDRRLVKSFATGQRNVIAYSSYSSYPFAGAGLPRQRWSFVMDTSKGSLDPFNPQSPEVQPPIPFLISDLYERMEKDAWALGLQDVLEIEGKLYVQGKYLPEKKEFFHAGELCPVTDVDQQTLDLYKEHPSEDVRYYQCLRFNFWRGEMILTAFLRFVRQGKDLFTELEYFLLPPLKAEYYWVDELEGESKFSMVRKLFFNSLDRALPLCLQAPVRLLREQRYLRIQRKIGKRAGSNPAFDYGAEQSLRFFASNDEPHLFFQSLDEQMYLKIVDRQILDSLVAFLDEHQIDTTEIRQREQTILNNNTYNNGPINNSGFLVAGSGSQMLNSSARGPAGGQSGPASGRPVSV